MPTPSATPVSPACAGAPAARATDPPVSPAAVGRALADLHAHAPLVHCLTNHVVAHWTANVLLAVGAQPTMVDNVEEAGPSARRADALLVNLGTPQESTTAAMAHAVAAAERAGTPWVLDPVGVGGLVWRTRTALDLLARHRPTIVRGNASEVLALRGGAGGRGPESVDDVATAIPAADALAREHAAVVAVSGATDFLTDGARALRLANGTPLLTRITGGGCALGALMAAFSAVTPDPLLAATAATATLTVAAEHAAARSTGPGSFAVALLDDLAALTPTSASDQVRLEAQR